MECVPPAGQGLSRMPCQLWITCDASDTTDGRDKDKEKLHSVQAQFLSLEVLSLQSAESMHISRELD